MRRFWTWNVVCGKSAGVALSVYRRERLRCGAEPDVADQQFAGRTRPIGDQWHGPFSGASRVVIDAVHVDGEDENEDKEDDELTSFKESKRPRV